MTAAILVAPEAQGPRAAIGSATTRIRPSSIPKASRRGTTRNARTAATSREDASDGSQAPALMSRQVKWIKSGGGPLICVESGLAQYWLGVMGNSIARGPDSVHANDYKRACSVSDYLGKIPLSGRHAVILGDMPLETMIWRHADQVPRIVRVYYADPDVDVVEKLESISDLDFSNPVESIQVDVRSNPLIVFDAAHTGRDIPKAHLTFELAAGDYRILTKQFQPDDRTSVLVHKFERGTQHTL